MEKIPFEGKTYTISFAAMPESLKKKLGKKDLERYLELLKLVQVYPKKVYKSVKEFANNKTNIPEIVNLLTFAHIQNHRIVEAEKLIKETFEKHPDYLFARINYADQCIRKKKLEEVPKLFSTFDLQELCPNKEIFHTSEFRGFLIMMAYYHLALKNKERAVHYFEGAKRVEPHHPSVTFLEKKLFKRSLFKRLFSRS